jgi:transcriptional regulator with XRE-family HTH domain
VDSQAIAKWAEQQPSKLHKGKGSALTQEQLTALVALRDLGKTQAEIAQELNCDQATVSRWLSALQPSGDLAGAYLRGKQYPLARKFVKTARAADILNLLDRYGSIPAAKSQPPISIAIGLSLPGLSTESAGATSTITVSPVPDSANG